jgi:hypothetical protein
LIIEKENSSCIVINSVYRCPPRPSFLVHQPRDRGYIFLYPYHMKGTITGSRVYHVLPCRSDGISIAYTKRTALRDSAIGF